MGAGEVESEGGGSGVRKMRRVGGEELKAEAVKGEIRLKKKKD